MTGEGPRYQTLASQVAARILQEIDNGTWVDRLPPERALVANLKVSRKTLRKALAELRRDGFFGPAGRWGRKITARSTAVARKPVNSVALLTPEPLEQLRPYTAMWIDGLRAILFERGFRLVTFCGPAYFNQNLGEALDRLVKQSPQSCWLLMRSSSRSQRWFHKQGLPCVVAGSCHEGIPLPNVDLDYNAICRHAAGMMFRLGHRRIAFLNRQSQQAGDLEGEEGFLKGAASVGATAVIARHDGTVDGAYQQLTRLFKWNPPTALLVNNPAFYLTTVSFLASRGLQVGRDVSLISHDNDDFLSYLRPTPARYSFNPYVYARRLMSVILLQISGQNGKSLAQRIAPDFQPGESLARPPEETSVPSPASKRARKGR
jgi:DNA-binding LacI/PurR family transcriptional regulator